MTQYLIRSMTITPWYEPQHTYLLKPEKRHRAIWSVYSTFDVMLFDSVEDALAHGAAVLGNDRFDVVPVIDLKLPTYWEVRKGNRRSRLIGTDILNPEAAQ
jgi:hypothetical protein